MKNEKYTLLVYTVFGIELLINIFFMYFFEKILNWNLLTFKDIDSNMKMIGIGLVFFVVIRLFLEKIINKIKTNFLLVFCYSILCLVLCCFYGALLAIADAVCRIIKFHNIVAYTFWITILVFIGITIGGYLTKGKNYNHPILNNIFIGSFVILLFNMFWGWNWVNIIIDIVDLIIVSLFIYLDTIKIRQHAKKLTQVSKEDKLLNILRDATDIYEDFIFIWIDLIDLLAQSVNDSD